MTILDFGNVLLNMGQGNWTAIEFLGKNIRFHMVDGKMWPFERPEADVLFGRWLDAKRAAGSVIELRPKD